jgi:hypothetical protein
MPDVKKVFLVATDLAETKALREMTAAIIRASDAFSWFDQSLIRLKLRLFGGRAKLYGNWQKW